MVPTFPFKMPNTRNEIFHMDLPTFEKVLQDGSITASVIGLGRIGLPTAVAFARAGISTIGVDINPEVAELTNNGICHIKDEPDLEESLAKAVKSGLLKVTTKYEDALSKSDVVILCLPTPYDESLVPDNSYLLYACKDVGKYLRSGSLVAVESTVSPGVVEEQVIPTLESQQDIKTGRDFGVASCPERANPSEILKNFNQVPRVVGGFDAKSTELAAKLYEFVFHVKIVKVSDCKTANAAKITENVFRDVNIALINELAILYDKMGIDIMEVIRACATKYNFVAHYPGPGVGGPCLPVNSYQIAHLAKQLNLSLNLVKLARQVNENMPNYVMELLDEALKHTGKVVKDSIVAVLGISYKPNVRDVQLSPLEAVIKQLEQKGARIRIYDPMFIDSVVFEHKTEKSLEDAVSSSDAVIIGTAHDEFLKMDLKKISALMHKPSVLVDTRNVISPESARKSGLIYRGIGRGQFDNS